MSESVVYNCDCMEYMKTLPDNAFDLAICDPPYGGGFTEGGGCQGWFSKHHQNTDSSQTVHVERERERPSAEVQPIRESGEHLREVQAPCYNRFGSPGSWFERYKREPDETSVKRTGGASSKWRTNEIYGKKIIAWDVAPGEEYFKELFRVSRNQIIWGGNYFALPPTRCFLIWRKLTISESFTMAMAEYAWTSFNENAKVFECAPQGRPGDDRFHPTQKPIALYKWVLSRYAKKGDRILDTHLGSGSSRIAAYDLGFDFVGCEIDKTYFDLEEKRFAEYTKQIRWDLNE